MFSDMSLSYFGIILASDIIHIKPCFSFNNHIFPMLNIIRPVIIVQPLAPTPYATIPGELTQWALVLLLKAFLKQGWLMTPYLYTEMTANNINIYHRAGWSLVNLVPPITSFKSEIYFSHYGSRLEFVNERKLNKIGR